MLVDDLVDESKASYKYLSISGSEFSYEHCPEDVKKAMLGKMASNDLAESSFAGVTAQVQCFGRIGMSAAAAVSDTARNGFLFRGEMKKRINRKRKRDSAKMPEKEKKLVCIMVYQRSYRLP